MASKAEKQKIQLSHYLEATPVTEDQKKKAQLWTKPGNLFFTEKMMSILAVAVAAVEAVVAAVAAAAVVVAVADQECWALAEQFCSGQFREHSARS